jgi:perosamine synthetase
MIPIFEPKISAKAKINVNKALKDNWISSQGNFINQFEKKLAKFHKRKFALVTSSCTTALHLSLLSLNLKKGDEVICPALTFIAPANMVLLSNLKLKLVDIDPITLTIDITKLKKVISKKTKALVVVHQFGHAAHMKEIIDISRKYNIKIIEDNAESIGGYYKNKILGSMGDVSTLSFYGNKIITTGEGGALLTNSKKLYRKCKILRDHGMSIKKRYYHIMQGYNYRMTNMQAAIGCSQIDEIKKILKKRLNQQNYYYKKLKKIKEIKIREFANWCQPVHWLTTITLNKKNVRDRLIKFLKKNGIDVRQMVNPVSDALYLKKKFNKKDYPVSYETSKNSLHLPSGLDLKKKEINFICNKINLFFIKK